MIARRLGTAPPDRQDACIICNNCPDVFELEDGDYAVIGKDATEELRGHLPPDAGCGEDERIVRIPREVFLAALHEATTRAPMVPA